MNIPPSPTLDGADRQKRLAKAAERWIGKHDRKRIKFDRLRARQQRAKDERQVRENPKLIDDRRKALFRRT